MTKKKKRKAAAPRQKKEKPAIRPAAEKAPRGKAAAADGRAGARLPPAAIPVQLAEATGSLKRGDLAGAERGYRAVLSLEPDHADALHLLGTTRAQAGDAQEAVALITRAIEIRPGAAEAHNNLGCAYTALKRPREAMDCFRRAIEIRPAYIDAQRNFGRALLAAKRFPEAIECLRKLVKLKPDARTFCDLGNALKALGRAAEAGEAYRKALAIDSRNAEAHYELGNALATLGRLVEAAKAYRQAIAIQPEHAGAHNNLGNVLRMAGHYEDAIASYERALAITPRVAYAPGMIWSTRALICDWRGRSESLRRMTDALKAGEPTVSPFVLVGALDDPADQMACAVDYVRRRRPGPPLAWRGKPYRHDRIRVAYVSADFRDHPVAWLIAGLIEQHDRKRFETFGISLGAAPTSATRERLKAGFEHFVDVRSKSDGEVAALLREREIDIAVDLMGHTTDSRPGIFARRAAPVQVGYLGFPGTTGAGFIDYLLADAFVIPEDQRIHYTEKVACLPHCYLPHDNTRRIVAQAPARAAAGLPERGFVFCCFNASIKIAPESFDVWMRLLRKVDGSVLWLAKGNPATQANLRREAQARGVDPVRLVFAPRVDAEAYYARYRLADLFLDTMTYNAHSTAVDVLWAGVPVLTCPGKAFASRVCASALRAAGLPELIAGTVEEYETRALELATRPELLRAIREKLAANRPTAPLFDTDRFRRHIESAYRTMWEINQRGEPPRAFTVAPLPPGVATKAPREESRGAAELHTLLAAALASHKQGDLAAAERGYRAVLAKVPDHFRALSLLGAALAQAGKAGEAVELISRAIAVHPAAAEPHNNLGHALGLLGRTAESMACFRKAIALKPGYADPYRNLGKALYAAGQYQGAVECFQKWTELKPGAAEAHFNLGNALLGVRRGGEAIASFDRALAARPGYAEALNNRGNALQSLRRMEEAVATYDKALAVKPAYPEALNNRANALLALRRYGEAAAGYEAALALDPAMKYAAGMAASCRAYECDWNRRAALDDLLLEGVRNGKAVAMPLIFLSVSSAPADQLACSVIHARDQYPAQPPLWRGERYRHDRIRVAYLSGDFRDHPVAWLSAELLERHDRSRFETHGISFGPPVPGVMRERLKGAFEHFTDVRGKSDAAVAAALRELEIDIAVDLMGYTEHARPRIFARRPAPVQVNYLGFPATMGAEYMDYILADRFVIPESEQRHYSERVAYLPDCYLPTTRHPIAAATPTRAVAGLPERGFVYCCFNNTYKINPAFFDIWMRVLRQVEGSVLWLSPRNPGAVANLKREAQARGISPERLVFAQRVDAADYLARLRLADLFLDTTPYNAHTTASDVLWAGVPVLTCAGSTFAGRVAGSLLGAVGLPELIAQSHADYEALAIDLARQPQRLAALKQRLTAGRDTAPLFDTDRFRRHVESAYRTMWETSQRGEPPRAFSVEPLPPRR